MDGGLVVGVCHPAQSFTSQSFTSQSFTSQAFTVVIVAILLASEGGFPLVGSAAFGSALIATRNPSYMVLNHEANTVQDAFFLVFISSPETAVKSFQV
jgi:hypothetical protein